MKRLKLKCPFAGYGTRVVWATFTISSAVGAFFGLLYEDRTNSIEFSYIALFLSYAIAALLTLTVSFLWLNRLTDEERIKIQNADEPVWRKLNAEENRCAAATMSFFHIEFIIIYVMVIVVLLATTVGTDFKITPLFIIIVSAVLLLITAVYVWYITRERMWRNMDDTAECTTLPVSYVYVVKNSSKSRWTVTNYAVIYTNKGKLVLPAKSKSMSRSEAKKYTPAKIEKICIVKYKGMLTYFAVMRENPAKLPETYYECK